jgi:acetyl-CoA carboxylase carboxyltransferase component
MTVQEWDDVLADLERRRAAARAMGTPDKLARQVQAGKLNARERIAEFVDDGSWFEIQPRFGASILTGVARIGRWSVALVANQPNHRAGAIDADAADKAASFVTVADSFHLPLVFLTDNTGVLAGSVAEQSGILRHAGRMFAAQHAAAVPKIQVTLRKEFGFGGAARTGGQLVTCLLHDRD